MSEFMEKHSVNRLIGSPPGYIGYEEGGQLTERIKRSPYSVLLLDEIEKAHPDVCNVLLQVLDDGRLTDGLGTTVDLKNTIIIMTSNIGARHLVGQKDGLGFQNDGRELLSSRVETLVRQELKQVFNPEFLNRLDDIIIFNPLTEADLIQILELMVQQLNVTLAQREITITVTDEAKAWMLEKTITDRSYGARPLRRALQRYIEDPLSEALIRGTVSGHRAFLEVYPEGNSLFYRQVGDNSEKSDGVLLYGSESPKKDTLTN
jgi:ATP-dependent Clp protease ATP-binding subunit ClpC